MKPAVEPASQKEEISMHKFLFCFIFFGCSLQGLGQGDIAVGNWRSHNAFNRLIGLTSAGQSIYAAARSAIFEFDPVTGESTPITKLTGLNDTGIKAISYNEANNTVIICYENGNIDLVRNNKIINFPDLLKASISGSKIINHIANQGDLAFLSADFGVMILDLKKLEVKDTYFELGKTGNDLRINSSVILGDSLFLATEEGIMRGNLNDNLKDFSQWVRFSAVEGIPETDIAILLAIGSNLLAAVDSVGLLAYNSETWGNLGLLGGLDFVHGYNEDLNAVLTTTDKVYLWETGQVREVLSNLIDSPKQSILINDNLYIADGINGLIIPDKGENFYPNGPFSNQVVRLFSYRDKVIALPPAISPTNQPLRSRDGYSQFSDGQWQNFNSIGYPGTSLIPEFHDITDGVYSFYTDKLYLSSYGYGVMTIDDGVYTIFDETNSSLVNADTTDRNVYVTGIDANANGLSVINYSNSSEPLHIYSTEDSQWLGHGAPFPASAGGQILSFNNNTNWVSGKNGQGIVVYDAENNRSLLLGTEVFPDDHVNDMLIDREGKMWVATDKGVYYFIDAEHIFDYNELDAVQPIFEGQLLFRNDKVTALAVDGGNRIWMSTVVGLWLFSHDGQVLENYFNTSNSPLPSNDILDLAVNYESGEVFVATTEGLVSYRGTSTLAGTKEPLKIFPNPVILNQHDVVTIEGVPENTDVWITDASGRLVFRTIANGNTAVWQGVSSNRSLSSGVYFVFVSTEDGEDKQVGKIALVN